VEGIVSNGGRKVLVIDDDDDVRSIIQALLESEGFEVSAAADGHAGLESQRKSPAAVVVTDIFMPDKDGIETIAALRQEFPLTKIVVLSGGAPKMALDYLRVAVELGAVIAIKKPFRPQELVDAVRGQGGWPAP
jgi:two-component system chemotaxis response regulator CheY